jgi:hypothetical protein
MERGISWKADGQKGKSKMLVGELGKVKENPKILLKDPKYFYPIG